MERKDLKEKTRGWSKNPHKIRVDQKKDILLDLEMFNGANL